MKFKPGDVVRLKSGGPKMTVSGVHKDITGTFVRSEWFYPPYNHHPLHTTFKEEQLVKVVD